MRERRLLAFIITLCAVLLCSCGAANREKQRDAYVGPAVTTTHNSLFDAPMGTKTPGGDDSVPTILPVEPPKENTTLRVVIIPRSETVTLPTTTVPDAETDVPTTTEPTSESTAPTTVSTTEPTSESTAPTTVSTTEPTTVSEQPADPLAGLDLSFIEDNGLQYVWTLFDDRQKLDVAEFMNCLMNHEAIKMSNEFTADEFSELRYFMFQMTWGYSHAFFGGCTYKYEDGTFHHFEINYLYDTKEESDAMKQQVFDKVDEIIASCTATDERERIKYFHDWIIDHVKYDFTYERPHRGDAYGAFIEGEAVCQGYARAMQMLLTKDGFDSIVFWGTSLSGGGHAWNMVRLSDGKWYNIDVTWDDVVDINHNELGAGYKYFLVSDDVFLQDHIPDEGYYYRHLIPRPEAK